MTFPCSFQTKFGPMDCGIAGARIHTLPQQAAPEPGALLGDPQHHRRQRHPPADSAPTGPGILCGCVRCSAVWRCHPGGHLGEGRPGHQRSAVSYPSPGAPLLLRDMIELSWRTCLAALHLLGSPNRHVAHQLPPLWFGVALWRRELSADWQHLCLARMCACDTGSSWRPTCGAGRIRMAPEHRWSAVISA